MVQESLMTIVIYDHHIFIVQANVHSTSFSQKSFCRRNKDKESQSRYESDAE
jgi:hypothetical protein